MPYLNSDVFYHALPEGSCELASLPPRAMAGALERGELDAGPLAVADVLRLGENVRPLADLCVATKRRSVSILLFSSRDVGDLDGARVGITDHTSSSLQLLRVLFAERWGVEPAEYALPDGRCDAQLLIGDPALQKRRGIDGYPHVYDLGSEWFDHTGGMPFVYARWVARSDADAAEVTAFEGMLVGALKEGMRRLPEIAERRPELGMSTAEKLEYLRGFTYRMGSKEELALERFRRSLARLPVWRPEAAAAEVT